MVPKLFPTNLSSDMKILSVFICTWASKQQSCSIYPLLKASIKMHMPSTTCNRRWCLGLRVTWVPISAFISCCLLDEEGEYVRVHFLLHQPYVQQTSIDNASQYTASVLVIYCYVKNDPKNVVISTNNIYCLILLWLRHLGMALAEVSSSRSLTVYNQDVSWMYSSTGIGSDSKCIHLLLAGFRFRFWKLLVSGCH